MITAGTARCSGCTRASHSLRARTSTRWHCLIESLYFVRRFCQSVTPKTTLSTRCAPRSSTRSAITSGSTTSGCTNSVGDYAGVMTVIPDTEFGARVRQRLQDETLIWFTTTSADGTPQPNPVWFLWEPDTES